MHVGFTGTRQGMTDRQKETLDVLLNALRSSNFHHGGANGADTQASEIAKGIGYNVCAHLPESGGRDALLNRNKSIVDSCQILIAAPSTLNEVVRSGTWYTIRYARQMNRPTIVIDP